jgi:xanthine dehydrogenase accessory factor
MIFDNAAKLKKDGTSFGVVTLLSVRGSAPQDPGAKCIITENGLFDGTVGGGKVEAAAIKFSQELIKNNTLEPKTVTWNLQTDIGMTCGGEVTFLFETFISTSWPIVVFGAGHVSQALCRLLSNLECQVTCIDPRREWVDKLDNVVRTICTESPKDIVKELKANSFFISMTKGHAFDVPILEEIAKQHGVPPYVGVIGSKIKGDKIKSELKELGVSEDFINALRVPIGLPLGQNHPYEIAVSISAELLQVRDS